MTGKDLFVTIYCSVWASMEVIFVFVCALTNCLPMSDVIIVCNVAFLIVTSIIVFVKPVRKYIDDNIISKL